MGGDGGSEEVQACLVLEEPFGSPVSEEVVEMIQGMGRCRDWSSWQLFGGRSEISVWVSQEGGSVLTPLERRSDPRLDLSGDVFFEFALKFARSGRIGWLHAEPPPGA